MSVLVTMPAEAFDKYIAAAIKGYAEQNTLSGRWPASLAQELSRTEHEKLLPQGLATKDNYFFEIQSPEQNCVVGSVWVAVIERTGVRMGYVYDVKIDESYRRQGHATRAFRALESFIQSLGLATIGLNVFAYNTGAKALYESLGYGVTNHFMQKNFEAEIKC
jgi:ribosomal protein S18 acetylase RimI-like enzyme